jgi:hypothetical protein
VQRYCKRRAIFQEDRHSGKIVLQESMTFTIFCGQNFLDIQDRVSYGSTMKSNVLSNVFISVLITIAFACWIGFQIWWDRKDKIDIISSSQDDFIAIPVFSHFVQTLGEWLGTWVAIVGFVFSLLTTIILGGEGAYLSQGLGPWFLNISAISIILMPIYGFLIVISARVFAEALRALVSIANNTKKS